MVSLFPSQPISTHSVETNPTSICTGVKSYNVSLENQTADVTADESLSYEQVLEKIKKTGKTVNSGEADGVQQSV